jgi:hypothetical protein
MIKALPLSALPLPLRGHEDQRRLRASSAPADGESGSEAPNLNTYRANSESH